MPLVDFHLLVVTDRSLVHGRSLSSALLEAMDGGVPAIQLRERDLSTGDLLSLARQLRTITKERAVPLLINDCIDIALALDLDGVHLRATSIPVAVARRVVGSRLLIGASAHSVEEVQRAGDEGADYVVVGPIFDTPSKRAFGAPLGLDVLAEACRLSSAPVFAIGGITRERIGSVRDAGAFGVAMIGGILGQADVGLAARDLQQVIRACWPSQTGAESSAH